MREDDPLRPAGHKGALRADMWTEALARHEAGRLRATELRGSDYFGPGTTPRSSYLNDIVIDAHPCRTHADRAGRAAPTPRTRGPTCPTSVPSPPGSPPTTAAGAGPGTCRPRRRAPSTRLLPTSPRLAGTQARRVRTLPRALGTAAGVVVPFMRELRETRHQFERPFVLDSSLTEQTFGLAPTPWEEALTTTIAARRSATPTTAAVSA